LADPASRAVITAENIGSALGSLARRLDALKKRQAGLATDIHALLAAGHRLLSELGHSYSPRDGRQRRQRKSSVSSDATKAKLRASWQQRRAEPQPHIKKRTMSEEARAKIAAAQKARWAKARQS
jgi:hypothetical protein